VKSALSLRAGRLARQLIQERGLRVEDVAVLPGASGGAKWLILGGIDRYLFGEFLTGRRTPLPVIGSSIGSWRMACLGQKDPLAALERSHHGYIYLQKYSPKPTIAEVTTVLTRALDILLGPTGVDEILDHPWLRLHVITARGRWLLSRDRGLRLSFGLALSAVLNTVHRRTLALAFERTVFDTPGSPLTLDVGDDLPTARVPLSRRNLRSALMASGSIPLWCEGVRVDGAEGVHWDGGILDYHPHLNWGASEGLVLYPHFYPYLVPGWFDKALPWRRASGSWLDRVLLLAPSAQFVASLPNGKIPERQDFKTMSESARIRTWQGALDASARLGDELRELVATNRIADLLEPL
jgi:hypothetical protein